MIASVAAAILLFVTWGSEPVRLLGMRPVLCFWIGLGQERLGNFCSGPKYQLDGSLSCFASIIFPFTPLTLSPPAAVYFRSFVFIVNIMV